MYRALEAQGLLITGLLGEIRGLRQDLRGYASYRPNPARLLRDDDGQKVSPYAYIPDTQRLLIACLDRQRLDKQDALAILQYYTRRNYVAYRSHRKNALRRLPRRLRR